MSTPSRSSSEKPISRMISSSIIDRVVVVVRFVVVVCFRVFATYFHLSGEIEFVRCVNRGNARSSNWKSELLYTVLRSS